MTRIGSTETTTGSAASRSRLGGAGLSRTYGIMYGMEKTTVYLPVELKTALRRTAKARRTSEAQLIREGVALVTADAHRSPRLPLFASGQAGLATNIDEALRGFGER